MYRAVPVYNRLCHDKELEKNKDLHRQRVLSVQSTLRQKQITQLVPSFIPIDVKLNKQKKEQLKESRFTEIERENRILLEKITLIMGKTNFGAMAPREGASRSLNQGTRKQFVQKVQDENSQFLHRLQNKKSNYSVKQWETDFQRNQNRVHQISLYPYSLSPTGTGLLTDHSQSPSNLENGFSQQQQIDELIIQQSEQLQETKSPEGEIYHTPCFLPSSCSGSRVPRKYSPFQKREQQQLQQQQCLPQLKNKFESSKQTQQQYLPQLQGASNDISNSKDLFPMKNNLLDNSINKLQRPNLRKHQKISSAKDPQMSSKQNNSNVEQQQTDIEMLFPRNKSTSVILTGERVPISGEIFNLEIRWQNYQMLILAEQISSAELKVIEIPSSEALQFIREECQNNPCLLPNHLKLFEGKLFLVGNVPKTEKMEVKSTEAVGGDLLNQQNQDPSRDFLKEEVYEKATSLQPFQNEVRNN